MALSLIKLTDDLGPFLAVGRSSAWTCRWFFEGVEGDIVPRFLFELWPAALDSSAAFRRPAIVKTGEGKGLMNRALSSYSWFNKWFYQAAVRQPSGSRPAKKNK